MSNEKIDKKLFLNETRSLMPHLTQHVKWLVFWQVANIFNRSVAHYCHAFLKDRKNSDQIRFKFDYFRAWPVLPTPAEQWTKVGCSGCSFLMLFTRITKSTKSDGSFGTPWSGQFTNCSCWIDLVRFWSSPSSKCLSTTPFSTSFSSVILTDKFPLFSVLSNSGQYLWHFWRPRSTSCVTITIRVTLFSCIICQKSSLVWGNGPF